jgi:hypothetical protein
VKSLNFEQIHRWKNHHPNSSVIGFLVRRGKVRLSLEGTNVVHAENLVPAPKQHRRPWFPDFVAVLFKRRIQI